MINCTFFAHILGRGAQIRTDRQKINVILASGSGTNTENIIRYFQSSDVARVVLVVSNKADAYVLERAKRLQVPSLVIPRDKFLESGYVCSVLQEYHADLVVLAGFLLRIPDDMLAAYPQRIVNIHPSLLPKYGGKGMYGDKVHQAVVAAGEKESGITIHYIDGHFDEGVTIFQAKCPVLPDDTPEEVAHKVHALEYEHYPKVIERILAEKE